MLLTSKDVKMSLTADFMRAKQLYSGLLVRFQFQLNQQIDVVPYHKKHLV